jgi:NAD(P)-dependent dehydrogenase (short-subunit alcohol dehydrogenase family)
LATGTGVSIQPWPGSHAAATPASSAGFDEQEGTDEMKDLFSLQRKKAVVLGAGGMGTAIAGGLLRYGAKVMLADRDKEGLERSSTALGKQGHKNVMTHTVDATDEESVQKLVDDAAAELGSVDVLVNALGYNFKAHATEFPMDEWDKLMAVNVKAVMLACKLFGAHMIEQGGGKIINLSSVRDDRGALGGNAGYCATKGAVKMITKQLGVELAPYKVYVNALGPIITVTPMTKERIKQDSSRYERMLLNVPMGRMADVEDLVGPAVFLASSASDFITGTTLYVDGGMMAYA